MNNLKTIYLLLGLMSVGVFACNSESNQQISIAKPAANAKPTSSPAVPVLPAQTTVKTTAHPPTRLGNLMNLNVAKNFSAGGSGLNPAHGLPGHDCAVAVGAPLPNRTPIATASTGPSTNTSPNFNVNQNAGLNPAHGQPGHDCAVAVGAPLPGTTNSNQTQVPSSLSNIAASPAQLTTPNFNVNQNAGLNPAHGQPGHDCGIAVGAPLSSAAANTTPPQTTPNFNLNAGGNLNPAHGQPGHDCGVAVGAPLPS